MICCHDSAKRGKRAMVNFLSIMMKVERLTLGDTYIKESDPMIFTMIFLRRYLTP